MNSYKWPESFWHKFRNTFWEKDPCVFKSPAEPFISKDELFKVVTSMPSRGRSDRFWIAKNKPLESFSDFRMSSLDLLGPKPQDKSFEIFFQRINNHQAGINIHNLDSAMPELAKRVKDFPIQLNKVHGSPTPTRWVLDTFFGNYKSTPFGIHIDPASVFSFILEGNRTYATWQLDYFKKNDPALGTPNMKLIEQHLKNAELFNAKSGDIFYWPSNRWHIALSDGNPSIVAQISAYFDPKTLEKAN